MFSQEEFSALVFRAKKTPTDHPPDPDLIGPRIRANLGLHGALRVTETEIKSAQELVSKWLDPLGFSAERNFRQGGRTSTQFQTRWIPGTDQRLRLMDYYPPEYYLLPNNEVQYARETPLEVLIYCDRQAQAGGRTFVHSAKRVEEFLRTEKTGLGEQLLLKLNQQGFSLTVGFLDQHDPLKSKNYFSSWQEYFQTEDLDRALELAKQQYDDAWEIEENDKTGVWTLMTRLTIPAFVKHPIDGQLYLRFPRMARTAPERLNGYRKYTLGGGDPLSEAEQQLLIRAYLDTREGLEWQEGDFVVFDNLKYGHSKESYTGEQSLLVAMAGTIEVNNPTIDRRVDVYPTVSVQFPLALAGSYDDPDYQKYRTPPNPDLWQEQFAMRVFDGRNQLTSERVKLILNEFLKYGALQIINTGLPSEDQQDTNRIFDQLGFDQKHRYQWGGRTSGRTVRGYVNPHFRTVDIYPAEMYLLPHNEILYQHRLPRKLMIYCLQPNRSAQGGRTFVHDARLCQQLILRHPEGEALLTRIKQHGFTIITGFIDQNHPLRSENYFRSWQERFDSTDRQQALDTCLKAVDQFDQAEWKPEPYQDPETNQTSTYWTLMTTVNVPGYKRWSGKDYLMFPRIAFDGPAFKNGYRRFLIGDQELTQIETQILLNAYWESRLGQYHQRGNILLIDNIYYGHSRESFQNDPDHPRQMAISMADSFWTDRKVSQQSK